MRTIEIDTREIASILAGLRLQQQRLAPQPRGKDVDDIATNLGEHEALTVREIESLCERLLHV